MHVKRMWSLIALILVGSCVAGAGRAATLVIDSGELIGARGVVVGSQVYDVDFIDGTCAALYSECDEDADFVFSWTDPATALAARQALLDQVFLAEYDSQPELTRGCEAETLCSVQFPIQKLGAPDAIGVAVTTNDEDEIDDNATGQGGGSRSLDLTNVPSATYAVWSGPLGPPTVPVSSPALLLLAFSCLSVASRQLGKG